MNRRDKERLALADKITAAHEALTTDQRIALMNAGFDLFRATSHLWAWDQVTKSKRRR